MFEVISDNSGHNLPIGAHVEPCAAPEWADPKEVQWYSQGGDGDEVAIDSRDLRMLP